MNESSALASRATPATSMVDRPASRRQLLKTTGRLGLGALLVGPAAELLAACSSSGGGASSKTNSGASAKSLTSNPIRFQFNWVPDVEFASWYIADTNGLFAKNNVPVKLMHGGENTPAVPQLITAGQADMGVASDELQLLQANAQGGDFVVIAAMYQRSPFGYTWLASSDISGPADLVGKRIGGNQGDQIRIEAVFKVNKLPVKYTFVPMSYDPEPLVKGDMIAITSYTTNQPIQLGLEGVKVKAVTFSDFGLKSYGDVIFASRSYLDKNGDAVVAFLRGLLAGVQANIADPSVAVGLTVDKYGKDNKLDPAFETKANAAYIGLLESDYTKTNGLLAIDPDYMANEIFAGYGAAGQKNLPPVSRFVDMSYLKAAKA